ncbi:hypothetical protein DSM106972_012620 [Dulcicalothrix desertica PCC 7102]|uniref:Uncharacterized protein n=1 Tax=Dulcicalothrix desertica PCC 7102 TaxID=232991 RepID=A0A3S1CRW3_9CYAN|nr:hypothetical protein [Dulcicalothrix desertica]RUT09209.1 hypothetical protein DSM106972_012620 [Dulcicalothrix desertica PCC 7102]TWH55038.1 hypothetical protein CAL7102_03140 [Dulcicalothrix desertica PCC 7102]
MSNNHINHKILVPSVHFLAFNLQESEVIKLKSNRRRISKDWLWETCDNIVSTIIQQQLNIKNYLELNKQP